MNNFSLIRFAKTLSLCTVILIGGQKSFAQVCSEIRAAGLVYCNDASVVNLSAEIVGTASCANIEWYSSAAIDVPLATGCNFTTPAVTGNIKYYVRDNTNQSKVVNSQVGFDFTDPSLTNPINTLFDGNIRTDLRPTQDFVLNSADVIISNWNGRTPTEILIEVNNYSDPTKSTTFNVPVPAGTAYTNGETLRLNFGYNFIAFDSYDISVAVNGLNIFGFSGTAGTTLDYDALFLPVVNVTASGPSDSRDNGIDGFGPFFNWDISAETGPGCAKKEVNIVQRCIEICDDNIDNDSDGETDEACEAFSCDGKLLQSINDEIFEMSIDPLEFNSLISFPFGINSLAYSAADNKVYSMIFDNSSPDEGKIVRIAANGTYQVLDRLITKDGVPLQEGYAADIGSDGNYYFLDNITKILYTFELVTLTELNRVQLPITTNIADITFNPQTGNLFGISSGANKRLIEMNPLTGTIINHPRIIFNNPDGTVNNNRATGGVVGGIYFLPSGRMIAYGSFIGDGNQNDMIQIDLDSYVVDGEVEIITLNNRTARSNDGASCPYTLYMSKTADVSSVEPDDEIIYTIEINNNTGFEAPLVTFRDSLSDYLTISSININDLGNANIAPGTGVSTKDLLIRDVNIPTGLSTVQFTARVNPAVRCSKDTIFNQAELTNLSLALGLSSVSDDPNTPAENDATAVDYDPKFELSPPNPVSNSPVCEGDTIILQDLDNVGEIVWSGPNSYLSTENVDSIFNASTINTGEYLAFRDSAGCQSDTVRVPVVVNPLPVASIDPVPPFCVGDTETITASSSEPSSTFTWILNTTGLSATNASNPETSATSDQDYTVVATAFGSCRDTASVSIVVNPVPTVSVTPDDEICFGESKELTATGADSYTWTPVATLNQSTGSTVIATPTVTTTYEVTGETLAGCDNTAEVTVTINPLPPLVKPADEILCAGDAVELTASGADSYLWFPATGLNQTTGTTVETSVQNTTTYKIIGETLKGCRDSVEVLVTVVPLPNLMVSGGVEICEGESTTLTASGANDYLWSPTLELNAANTASVVSTPTITRTYTVTGNASSSCPDSKDVTVTVNSQPNLVIPASPTICRGEEQDLSISGADTYVWLPALGLDNNTSADVTFNGQNTTTYEITGTNVGGCEDKKTITVNVADLPVLDVTGGGTICLGESATLVASGATNYEWSPATGLSSTNTATVTSMPSTDGEFDYLVIGENTVGCKDSAEVQVRVLNNPVPSIQIDYERDICERENLNFSISNSEFLGDNPSYRWFVQGNPTPIGTNKTLELLNQVNSPTVFLEVTSDENCVAPGDVVKQSNLVTPTIYPFPDLMIADVPNICKEENVILSVTDNNGVASSYRWVDLNSGVVFPATGNQLNLGLVNSAQNIRVVASSNGCADSTSKNISVVNVDVSINASEQKILQGDQVRLVVVTGAPTVTTFSDEDPGFSWTSNLGSETRTPDKTAIYYVTASENGCSTSDSVQVVVIGALNAPYFFSPNDDESNDTWIVEELDSYDNTRVTIFNRWGSKIITLEDGVNEWDGLYRSGEPVPEGVYYYVIEGEVGEREVSLTGYVTIAK